MSEISIAIAGLQVATVRLEPNSVQGRDIAGQPALYLPFQLQLLPAGQKADLQYTLVRLAGMLQNSPLGIFAGFEVGPLALASNPQPYYRQQEALVMLDRLRITRFEGIRSGGDANFQIVLSSLVWCPTQREFEVPRPTGHLEVLVPKSHWAEKVVSLWNLSSLKVIEIEFPKSDVGEAFRTSYARVEEAERHFLNGQYKEVLTTLRLSFEALSKGLGFETGVKECFDHLFADSDPEKKEKAREALTGLYRFLHLGPHEQTSQTVVSRQDARFALTMAHAVFQYITPRA